MAASEIILLVNSLLSGIEMLLPKVTQLTKSGEITVAEQEKLLARIDSIRAGSAFEGPEWQPDSTT